MMKLLWSFYLVFVALSATVITQDIEVELYDSQKYQIEGTETNMDEEWWRHAVIYQIYPKSFMDSDGDGNGDLNGIASKLEHLKDAGITGTWLSPIFESPQVDQGYDISDYRAIDAVYGTLDDFANLLKKAKKLGIKIILDFVPNHTSDEHEWFKKSEKNVTGYENFYIWSDAPNGTLPNNWISSFRGSAWTWSDTRGQYYYHAFHEKQPDLNYRDENVVKAMKDVLTFWMDHGVDGFRIDAVPFLFEDSEMRDEPVAFGRTYDKEDESCLDHIYTQNNEETFDMIYQWRKHIDNYVKARNTTKKIMMTEVYAPIEDTMLYYGNKDGSKLGAHFTFNFKFITSLKMNFSVDHVVNAIHNWLDYIPKQYTSNWVLGNHDNHRVGSRLGKENLDAFNMITAFLPGVMITYYGEEIGMLDGEVTCQQGKDEQAKRDNCEGFDKTSRDFERTPFQWDSTDNAGFTRNDSDIYLPVAKNYKEVNLEAEKKHESHYSLFKELVQFRKVFQNPTEYDGVIAAKVSENVLEILRERDDGEFILLFNIGEDKEKIEFLRKSQPYEVVVPVGSKSNNKKGDYVTGMIELQPHESVILVKNGSSKLLCSAVILFICTFLNIYR